MFAEDVETVKQYYPKEDGHMSLVAMRQLMADFVLVGKTRDDTFQDISRTGMIKQVTEFTFFLESVFKLANFNPVGSTPEDQG